MVTTPPVSNRYDDDPDDHREDVEFLLGQVAPLQRSIRAARGDDLVRLLEAEQRLKHWLGVALLAHVASGGSVRVD
jgi:hypothetical protein